MTLQEFERHKDERIHLNACMVRDEVVKRIDGASCLKEEIVANLLQMTHSFSTKLKFTNTILLQIQMGTQKFQVFSEDYKRLQKLYPETIPCWAAAYAFPEGSI